MANPYSILHNYDQPLYSPDFNFSQTALQYKQVKLDHNRQKLQSAIDQFPALDVYRDVDREYVEERLQAVSNIANKYASGDVSSDSFTNSIIKNINQVIDPVVKNAVLSTRLFRKEQAQWEELRQKEPDAYNDKNYAYSLQASKNWREGKNVGEIYQGGGGVRRYVDYNKVIRENIPAIAKQLEAEWIEDAGVGPGGYFREISTKRAVSRKKMENVLSGFLGQKEMDQVRIDAWAKYSQMDDEDIKTEYESYFNPQLEASQRNIDKYSKLIEQEQDPIIREKYQALLDEEQKNASALESNSYDKVVEKAGKEAAYTTLFVRQYKDIYLNAYTDVPIEIKREVNQYDVESRNLELKLRQYDADRQDADRKYELDLRKQEFEEMKASGNGVFGNSSLPILGDLSEIDQQEGYAEGKVSHLKTYQQLEDKSIKDMSKLLSGSFGSLNRNQLSQLSGQLNDLAGKDKITLKIDGKTTTIDVRDPENFKILKNFQNYVLEDSPIKKFEHKGVSKIVNQIKNDLIKVAQGENPDIDLSRLPNFESKLVPGERDENGKIISYRVEKTNYKGGSYYGYLLKKSNRTEAENATLDLYTSMHLLSDPLLSKEQRKSVFSAMQNNIYSKIDSESASKLPQNWFSAYGAVQGHGVSKRGTLERIRSAVDNGGSYLSDKDPWLDSGDQSPNKIPRDLGFLSQAKEYEKLYKKYKSAQGDEKVQIKKRLNQIENSTRSALDASIENRMTGIKDFYLSDMTSGDLEWSGGEIGRGFDKYIETSFSTLTQSLEQRLSEQNMEMSLREMIYTPSQGATYDNIAYSIGLPKGSKMPITLVRRIDSQGRPTGYIDWSYKGGTPSKPVVVSSRDEGGKPLTAEQAASLGIKYAGNERPQYRASYGENAPKIELGSSKVDKEVENRVRKQISLDLPLDNVDIYLNEAEKYGVEPVVGEALNKFDKGSYKFKMIADNGTWHRLITLNGKEVYREDLGEGDYTDTEIKQLYDRAYYDNQILFHNYLIELIGDAQRSAKINSASRQ